MIKALWISGWHAFLLRMVWNFSTKYFYLGIQVLFQMFCLSGETFSGNLSMCVKITQKCDKNKSVRERERTREGGRKIASAADSGLFPRAESAEVQDSTLSAEVHWCALGSPVHQELPAFQVERIQTAQASIFHTKCNSWFLSVPSLGICYCAETFTNRHFLCKGSAYLPLLCYIHHSIL